MLPNPYKLTTETAHEMQAAIDNLYNVFAPYLSSPLDEGSPLTVTEAMRKPLRDKSLRQLTRQDLDIFVFKLFTTWGWEDNMRRFLPRILELTAGDAFDGWMLTFEDFFNTFNQAKWREWDTTEQRAIERYCETLFRYILVDVPLGSVEFNKLVCYLRAVSRIVDINTYLAIWEQMQVQHATLQIAHIVVSNSKIHWEKGVIWFVEWHQHYPPLPPQLQHWILRNETRDRIQFLQDTLPNSEYHPMLQDAIGALNWLIENSDWIKVGR
jgi:hypothetical protein